MPASFTLEINGNSEDIHLGTPHTGEHAKALRQARREFGKAERAEMALLKKVILVSDKADRLSKRSETDDINAELVAISEEQDALMDRVAEAQDVTLDAAIAVLTIALESTYTHERVAEILNALTDDQVRKCVAIQASGQVPADFFPSHATRQSPSGTGPGVSITPASSSSTDSQGTTSPADG